MWPDRRVRRPCSKSIGAATGSVSPARRTSRRPGSACCNHLISRGGLSKRTRTWCWSIAPIPTRCGGRSSCWPREHTRPDRRRRPRAAGAAVAPPNSCPWCFNRRRRRLRADRRPHPRPPAVTGRRSAAAAKPGEEEADRTDRPVKGLEQLADEMDGGQIGPVQIEFMEGLDVIVLRAARRDVERVRKIIEDIERLSTETKPTIDIVHLRYVGSQAMESLVLQVYQEILSPRQGLVTIRALVKPNALLLIGRPESVDVIKQLVGKLDQPVEPETQFEIFQLRHVSAMDAETTIRNFFVDRLGGQAAGAGTIGAVAGLGGGLQAQAAGQARPGLGTRVNVVSDFRTNALIVQASPRDLAEVRRLITQIDVESSSSANELRVFRLKNALASEIAPVLQDALNWQLIGNRDPVGATPSGQFGVGGGIRGRPGGQQQQERARLRSAMLTFMTIDAEGKKVLESGLLSDVRITADINGNALVVSGPPKSMGLIEALITELDHLPNAQAADQGVHDRQR